VGAEIGEFLRLQVAPDVLDGIEVRCIALACKPGGSDAHLFFELPPGAYDDETLIEFLIELRAVEQRNVLLILEWPALTSRPHE